MDVPVLARVLDRVEQGTTTIRDAETLRSLLAPIIAPALTPPDTTHQHHTYIDPRNGSHAFVAVSHLPEPDSRGSIAITTIYRLQAGPTIVGGTRRVPLDKSYSFTTRRLWAQLFDATVGALQAEAAIVELQLRPRGLGPEWTETARTVAEIVAYELHVPLTISPATAWNRR